MGTNKVRNFIVAMLFSCLPLSGMAAGQEEAMALLNKMCTAAKESNYRGVFAYQNGRKLQSIKIIHRYDEQGEHERLISLNGIAREIIRNNGEVIYISREGMKGGGIKSQRLGRGFPGDFLQNLHSAAANYDMNLARRGRIANRHVRELVIQPVDSFRYGYRLWVGEESHLLLQFELIDEEGEALETFSFSELTLETDIPDALLQPEMVGIEVESAYGEMTKYTQEVSEAKKTPSMWQVGWLPDGFKLVAQQVSPNTLKKPAVEHRVYSDGLSTISVFFEKMRARHGHLKGGSQMGAVNAFGTIQAGHFVTVVGEVPRRTVDQIGAAIQYSTPTK